MNTGADTTNSVAMITGAQIRAARALLQWSTPVLAKHCGVTAAKLRWAESFNSIPDLDAREIIAIEKALSAGGVEFSEHHGVRMKGLTEAKAR